MKSRAEIGLEDVREIAFFEGFSEPDLRKLLERSRAVSFSPGESIFTRGEKSCSFYVIASGKARVDVGGRYHDLARGDLVGEMAALTSQPRMATVQVMDEVDAIEIDCGTNTDAFLMEHPALAVRILKILVERLREVEERLDAWMGVHRA